MKLRQIDWKWLLLGLIALVLVGIAALPRLLVNSFPLTDRITVLLASWTGGEVKLIAPLQIQLFPEVAIKGGFELTNASRLPLVKSIVASDARISLDLAALFLGRVRIDAVRLIRPDIVLKEASTQVAGPDQTLPARVANLLNGAPFRLLRVRGGTVQAPMAAGQETIKKIDTSSDLSAAPRAIWSFGSFMLRNEAVGFALHTGAPAQTADTLNVPVTLSLTAVLLTAKFDGAASFTQELALDGNIEAEMANTRAFLRWAGIDLADGESLQRLSVSGQAHWNGTTLSFDDGSFTLDGNTAVGALAITPGGRPHIDGTLAFDRLALDPYVHAVAPTPPNATLASLHPSILNALDTDLRISAAEITAPAVKLGHGGFTISARQGRVSSEVGELEFCGGSASGQIDVDLSQPIVKASVTGKLSDLPIADCFGPTGISLPLGGTGTIRADVSSEGRDYGELTKGLNGPFRFKARNGTVSIDFAHLFSEPDSAEGDGWSNTATAFDDLTTECRLGDGHIWCEKFNMQTSGGLISGSGDINLEQQTLDWHFFAADRAVPLSTSRLGAETPPQISISGALVQPMIRKVPRATLGGASDPDTTKATQISPR
jgi:AsmA protein